GPIRDREGNLAGAVLSFRDISDRKHAERRLRELNEDLENRVRERTHALLRHREKLRAMATQLGSAEQRERRRLATDLHDYLAQLLVVCRMKLSTATSAAAPPPATAVKDAAMTCREEVLRGTLHEMDELLDQSLTYTRTLVSRLSPTILYEAGLLSALRWLAEQFEREGLEVEVQGSEFAAPDDLAIFLYQAVRELLYNVLKHARVKHAYVLVDQRENEIHVEVADTGAGFPPESLLQVPSEEGRFGLFNIRERIEAMGGAFELDSAPGCGAKIVLRLPAETPAQQPRPFWNLETPMLDEDTEPADTMRIVLVDDHSIVRDGLRRVIESDHHFKVVGEAANGEEAIALAHTLNPDLVVMDINMPRMNGIEATRIIKEALPSICIVGLSLEDTNEIRESMKKAGASAFVSKNGPSGEFHQVLREFSALHR
ncbi:MAG: response regulator, partial [Candidatus Hydrogenedentes bacterium]|nr:response regulator [Candidatus Hydrogenedentota bacterium]